MSDELIGTLAQRKLDRKVVYVTFRGDVVGSVPTEDGVRAETMLRCVSWSFCVCDRRQHKIIRSCVGSCCLVVCMCTCIHAYMR
jgi:hypothetical protein